MPMAYVSLFFSYREQLAMLPDDERGRLILAILDYAEKGTLPELSGAAGMCFSFIRAQIDRDSEKYDERCRKNRENIRKRWDAHDSVEYDCIQSYTNHTKKNKKTNEKDILLQPAADRTKKFVPPSLDEVSAYCAERGNGVDPQQFMDFYRARGWMCGRAKMKDWKAAVRTWERRQDSSASQTESKPIRFYQISRNEVKDG